MGAAEGFQAVLRWGAIIQAQETDRIVLTASTDTFDPHGTFSPTNAPRLPRTVVKRHRKRATVIWVSLIIAFVACECWRTLVLGRNFAP